MKRTIVILCCMFALGIAWTSIFGLPGAPPKREKTREFGASPVVKSEKLKAAVKEVAEPETEPPGTINYAEKTAWGKVTFTHTKHTEEYGFDCGECHHLEMKGGYNKCSSCHDNLKDTFHKNCYKGCHRKLKAEGKKTGPTTCRGCHIKEGVPEAPPVREITPKSEVSPVVPKEEPKAGKKEVAEPKTEPPEMVSYAEKSTWGKVTFTHTKHTEEYGFDCGECHHLEREGGYDKCSSCHDDLKEAFHKNCYKGCHQKLKAEGKKTGPTTCKACHIKGG
jgi:cytochrome c peroxidase